jgi:HlyD family secretion protein
MRGSTAPPIAATAIVSVLLITMIGLSVWYLTRQEPLVVQGEVQCRTFDMAARVDGRVAQIAVSRSENVKQGIPLIRIDNPELIAKYRQSGADLAVAEAELARVNAGFRAETIAVRKAQMERHPPT